MQLQWNSRPCKYLQRSVRQVHNLEQTQEVRLPEGMPDMGRILCAWGQPVLRSKEWRNDGVQVTGGITAWVLYLPEDGTEPRTMEVWLPIQSRWDCPNCDRDSVVRASCQLREIDARMLSARKMLVRGTAGILTEVLQPDQVNVHTPQEPGEEIQVLHKTYPVQLMKEAGEKLFLLQEELTVSAAQPKKLLACEGQCTITEQSAMGSKVVFRGACQIHLVYLGEDERIHGEYLTVPVAQFTDLEGTYDKEASAQVMMAFSSLEPEWIDGHIQLKCGLIAQYVICDRCLLEVAEDAYAPQREVTVDVAQEQLQSVLDRTVETLDAEMEAPLSVAQLADVAFYPDYPTQYREENRVVIELPGRFQTLYYDETDMLQADASPWLGRMEVAAGESSNMDVHFGLHHQPAGRIQADCVQLEGACRVEMLTTARQQIPMIRGMEISQNRQEDPNRPTLVLRRLGDDSLWDVAKRYGSTVDAIRSANDLQQEPAADQMLLIPIL